MEGFSGEIIMDIREFVFSDDQYKNWFFEKYYFHGSNSRYWTFQMSLNLLLQREKKDFVIVETGCQRMADDLGAGMSTSIFGEFCQRYGGKLYTVDLFPQHLKVCQECTQQWKNSIEYIESDSIKWLKESKGIKASLLYLDSLDYPIAEDGSRSLDATAEKAAQEHCLNEFLTAKRNGFLTDQTILMADDNQLPGGGKPKLLKTFLLKEGWICLFDHQQSLWIRE